MPRIIMLFLILLVCSICLAEEYSLIQLIDIAQENSLKSETAAYNYKNAASSLRSSYYSLLPSSYLSYGHYLDYDADAEEWEDQSSFSLSREFFLNDPAVFNISRRTLDRKNSSLALRQTKKQIAYDVLSLYLDVIIYQTNYEIYQQNLTLQQKIKDQIQLLYDNGKASLLDLKQSEISLLDYSIAVRDAEISLSRTRKQLFNYLNISDEGYNLTLTDFDSSFIPGEFTQNIALKQQKNTITKSWIDLGSASLDFLPDLSIAYSLAHQSDARFNDFDEYQRITNQIGIYASYNFCSLLAKSENLAVSRRNLKLQKLLYSSACKELENDISITNEELQNLIITRNMFQEKLTLAEQNLELAQVQYELGTIGLIDLDRSIIDLQDARLQHNSRFYEFVRKREELNLLLSNPILGQW
ncbi:MAG: TolC family protein [Candidatus Cloacimonetes bacterium]|nr:TolC family protein [Candidatus Cloacimonadota bacterium]